MAKNLQNILYLAIIRVDGQFIVAAYGKPEYADTAAQVVNAPAFRTKVSTGQRIRLITKQGVAVNFTGGAQGLAILAVTNAQYRDSIVFSGLIEDTKDRFLSKGYMWSSASAGSLSKKFKGDLSDLCKEYDDEKSKNKIARLREQVGVVQQTMQTNISKALDNLESTESLEASSENLVASSEAFHRGAKKLAWKEWLMLMKMRFLIFLVFVVIIGIIIAVVCADNACAAKEDPGTGGGAVAAGPAASANRL